MRYSRWGQQLSEVDCHDVLKDLALRHFQKAGEAGKPFEEKLSSGDLAGLIKLPLDYGQLSVHAALNIRQGLAFFQKRRDIDLGFDRRAVAISKFRKAELLCRETNDIFRKRVAGEFSFSPRTERVLFHAARKITHVLGDIPNLSDLKLRFGPGATTQVPKRTASARRKLSEIPACSIELSVRAPSVLDQMPAWAQALREAGPLPVVIHPGKVVFVPKSAKEDRSVMVEPTLNTMVQAGIGSFIAERLRRCGVDIRTQVHNQRAARVGSLDGSLATVDLSSASDTIATELVYDLLGVDWAHFLSRYRTGTAILEGQPMRLEKFCSMGNGFTFPLETLIFYAIAFGCCVEEGAQVTKVLAYGDDLVVPTSVYPLLAEVLNALGFVVNRDKSFSEGPFRESCGADYLNGIDIRPVYIKDRLYVCDLFRLHNHYFRSGSDEEMSLIKQYLSESLTKITGPDGYGDGHLLSEQWGRFKPKHLRAGFGGRIFDTFTWKARRDFTVLAGDRVLPTYSTYIREDADREWWKPEHVTASPDAVYVGDALGVPVPGRLGVNLISVYTLSAP